MKRIIRLTESELARIVRRVISEAPQGARPKAALGTVKTNKLLKYDAAAGVYNYYLYGNLNGTEAGYWKTGEAFTENLLASLESNVGGILSGTFTPAAGIDASGSISASLQPLTVGEYEYVTSCQAKGDTLQTQDYSFKGSTGLDRCGYRAGVQIKLTLPTAPGTAPSTKPVLIGSFNFSASQVQLVSPDKSGAAVNKMNIYMPANSMWGVGGKTVTPKTTTPVVKKG